LNPHRHWQSQWHPQNVRQCHPAVISWTGLIHLRKPPALPVSTHQALPFLIQARSASK
jgi:hypothetical protein